MKNIMLLILLAASAQAKFLFWGSNVTVTVSPTSATIPYNQRQNITAKVTGRGGAQGVQWSTSAGTLSGSGTSVSFIPPMACGVATVIAISKADPSRSAKATITVIQIAPRTMTLQPSSANISAGQSVQFSATQTGGCPGTF